MSKGIKEISELFDAMDVFAHAGGKVYKDKKIDMSDLPVLIDVAIQSKTILDAFEGLKEAVGEAKDLDPAEQMELVRRVFQVAEKYEAGRRS